MPEIVSADAKNGLIEAQDADGCMYTIYIDQKGVPRSGRMNTWLIPDGENASTGHIVEILCPVEPGQPLMIPWLVKVRHSDD